MRLRIVVGGLLAATVLTGCSSSSYKDRMDYLRKVAQRGAETHALIASQEATIDKPRCERAFNGLDTDDAPGVGMSGDAGSWQAQIQEFFVDSCLTGKPKPVPGDAPAPAPSDSSSVAPTASPSA